ncbi:MAG TPA: amylo-alpha-1,6-glucosidase [Candidatus Eremiobacteraceae bacterium]|nr:amylo-alpha-1,6-glucosidase [Candidatus Eremiobacteraceae bacterium]
MTKEKQRTDVAASFSPHQRSMPSYSLSETDLEMGPSLGNSSIWLNTKSTGAIERIFSIERGRNLIGSVSVHYGGTGAPLRPEPDPHVQASNDVRYIGLDRDGPAAVEIHPVFQRRQFSLGGVLAVTETLFVPLAEALSDGPVAYLLVEINSMDSTPHNMRVMSYARLAGGPGDHIEANFNHSLNALVARNRSVVEDVRIFGLSVKPTGYATTTDFGLVSDRTHVRAAANDTTAQGDVLGVLQLDVCVRPNEPVKFCVVTGVYCNGERAALAAHATRSNWRSTLAQSTAYMEELLDSARVITPDQNINRGAVWSKVNMRRVMAAYPSGSAFTNEPGISSNVVMRDVAWFVYGCDHFMPEFSGALLDKFASMQYPDGKLPEYYNAIDGSKNDYGLNINDDTPLFVLATNHHYRATGDIEWLTTMYPAVVRAARYIISQMDERDLVYCSADDPRGDVWAIASWRNVIPDYRINGAVTEINAECAAALRAAGHMAQNIGRPDAEAAELFAYGERVRKAMDLHLRNPENGLYYLNIDVQGVIHTEVTGDQVFPVMLRTCDDDTGYRIISRLNSTDFWTEAGLRTASRNDPRYDPSAYSGLIGGVWPGLTWWYAFAAARHHPEYMVKALRSSFEHYAANPKLNNTVPGQFSEWFDGESLINRGMRLSPWEPPRFLWAAIEGVCGLMVTTAEPKVNPLVPQGWLWVGVRRLCYHGAEISYFATRHAGKFHVCATGPVDTASGYEHFDEDISDSITAFSEASAVIAFRGGDKIVVLVGNVSDQTATIPINLSKVLDHAATYRSKMYVSERELWEDFEPKSGAALASLAIVIEMYGYRLIELQKT